MIAEDFKIDFENKKISYYRKGVGKIYTVNELYSYLMDTFDEPINMQFEIPIKAKARLNSKTKYFLINGWTIDKEATKHLKDALGVRPLRVVKKKAKKK